jgi:hypothetical protein
MEGRLIMKTLALSVALGASLVSTAAFAEQRPTYLAFSAPAVTAPAAIAAPALPKVAKRDNAFLALPLLVPILGVFAAVGLVVGVTSGGNSSPG